MNSKDFKALLERRLKLTAQTLDSKSKEYSTDDDKLHNFKKTGAMRGKHASEALQGMMDKHLTSYFDMLEKHCKGQALSDDMIDEKIGDIINYFILQEALFKEKGFKAPEATLQNKGDDMSVTELINKSKTLFELWSQEHPNMHQFCFYVSANKEEEVKILISKSEGRLNITLIEPDNYMINDNKGSI